jgi:hypothetical protein
MHIALFPVRRTTSPNWQWGRTDGSSRTPESIALSVDAGRPHAALSAESRHKLHAACNALHSLFGELDIPATWGVSDPFTSPLVSNLLTVRRSHAIHEIALRLESSWSTPASRRGMLADTLARCQRQAESTGVSIATLFADRHLLAGNHDLLFKRGIRGVRGVSASHPGKAARFSGPCPLRYGLWDLPVAHTLPAERALARGAIDRLLACGHYAPFVRHRTGHVSVEIARLVPADRGTWRALEKGLRYLVRLRDEDGVSLETLATWTARLNAVPAAAPQRSILSRAA